jgi:hypothetical protein
MADKNPATINNRRGIFIGEPDRLIKSGLFNPANLSRLF